MDHPSTCLNCGSHLLAGAHYCLHCGQTAHAHRLNLSHLAHEVIHFFTHADKGIFYTVKLLAIGPGIVVREYVKGRRKKYFSPLNFFLIVVGLFVFAQTTFKPASMANMEAVKKEVSNIPDPTVRERRLAKLDRIEKVTNFMARYSNYVNMAVTPAVALIFFVFFYRAGYNYTEHLVTNLYFSGFTSLVYIFIITPYLVLTKGSSIYLYGIFVFLSFEVFYRTFGYYQFLQKRGVVPLLKVIGVAIISVLAWFFFSRGMIGWYIETGFQ